MPSIIAKVTDAVTSGDPGAFQTLFEYQSVPCTTSLPGGSGGPPLCKAGEADRTPVDVIFSATCEGNYVRKDEVNTTSIISNTVRADSKLYAAYEYSGRYSGRELGYGSHARYFVIFARPKADPLAGSGTGYGIVTSDTGVLGIHFGCGWTPQEFANFNDFGIAVISPR